MLYLYKMKEYAIQLQKEGKSYTEIAKLTGKAKSTISYYLSEKVRAVKKSREKARKIEHKRLLIEYKGGKCEKCGYDRCQDALDFHHIDPKTKKFTIGGYANSALSVLKTEVDKCILVCANCHRELHHK